MKNVQTKLANQDVVALFEEMADLTRLQRGDPHRIRAFRNIAKVIAMLPVPLSQALADGSLQRSRGVGEGALARVRQILRTGSCDELRRLRAGFPAGIRELLKLRGVGPSRARLLHQHLGVGSVDELETALRAGMVHRLPGVGEGLVERWQRSIASYRRRVEGLSLDRALEVARAMRARLRGAPAVAAAEIVGSLRRGKERVGDIDLVISSRRSEAAVAAFCAMPELAELIARGGRAASGRLAGGQQVDLWVVPPEQLGAALHAYSGAQQHVVAIRERAARRGLQISEHGVFRREDGACLTPATDEAEVFAAVGLPWIAPELREHAGELDAAERGRLPQLIELGDLRGDLHMHTTASDGLASARAMREAARAAGLSYIAITDHSRSLSVARGLDEGRLLEQRARLRELDARAGGPRILAGVEVDILGDGQLDLDHRVLAQLDWVVASVHEGLDQSAARLTRRLIGAIESGVVDCVGHPTGRRLGVREGAVIDLEAVLQAAARHGVAVEINANPGRLDLDPLGARRAAELGVMVVINSDAHAPAELARRELGVAIARRGWLEARQVLNTWPLERLQRWRAQRRLGGAARLTAQRVELQPKRARPRREAAWSSAPPGLARSLARPGELEPPLRARLEGYLRGEVDPEVAGALDALAPDNPLQLAFELLARGGPPGLAINA